MGGANQIIQITDENSPDIDRTLADIVGVEAINTAESAVIKDGAVVWSRIYGDQSPGVPASSETLFDVASITKTVVAETVLRLVDEGELSLNESMADYWLDPDISEDRHHQKLTLRHALSHTTGFMNWRFFSDDGKLAFMSAPGEQFGYSGEGFVYLARYAEAKLGRSFEDLVTEQVFLPAGVRSASLTADPDLIPLIAQSRAADGSFPGHFCRPEGYCRKPGNFSPAGGMVIALDDYAKLFIDAMTGDGLSRSLRTERNTLLSIEDAIDCTQEPDLLCPIRRGYGLGWYIAELDGDKTIGHLGSDWSSVALAYLYEESRDGLIVLLNAPNKAGIAGMVQILRLLDSDSPELHGYITRLNRD